MLAILYLCVCAITGMVLLAIWVPDVRRLYLACAPSVKAIENIPSTLFVVAAGTLSGMILVPFVNYYVILGLSYFVASDKLHEDRFHGNGRFIPLAHSHLPDNR